MKFLKHIAISKDPNKASQINNQNQKFIRKLHFKIKCTTGNTVTKKQRTCCQLKVTKQASEKYRLSARETQSRGNAAEILPLHVLFLDHTRPKFDQDSLHQG